MTWQRGPCTWRAAALLLACAPAASATDLAVSVLSGGQGSVQVAPGALVSYEARGELTDALSAGLALFSLDLAFGGGPLAPVAAPTAAPMSSFAVPAGVNNPQGFGGLPGPGGLLQVGGGQNTLNNSFGPYPVGAVTLGVAQPGAPVTLAAGQLTAPSQPGTYTLSVARVVANVIAPGATGVPVWKVEPAGPGPLAPLVIEVQSPLRHAAPLRPDRARP